MRRDFLGDDLVAGRGKDDAAATGLLGTQQGYEVFVVGEQGWVKLPALGKLPFQRCAAPQEPARQLPQRRPVGKCGCGGGIVQ